MQAARQNVPTHCRPIEIRGYIRFQLRVPNCLPAPLTREFGFRTTTYPSFGVLRISITLVSNEGISGTYQTPVGNTRFRTHFVGDVTKRYPERLFVSNPAAATSKT